MMSEASQRCASQDPRVLQRILLQHLLSFPSTVSNSHSAPAVQHPAPTQVTLGLGGIPRARIAQRAPAGAVAPPSKLFRQVLQGDLLLDGLQIVRAQDIDLGNGRLVEPALDDTPDGLKRPGSVDDVELAHRLRVAVLTDARGGGDVVLDAVEVAQGDVLEVEDRARRLDGVPDRLGTRGQPLVEELLVLVHEPLQLPLLGRQLVERVDVE